MSSCGTEGAENTDDELSSTDFEWSESQNMEEHPLHEDIHQQNLIAIHLTEKQKKGEGELNGRKYIFIDNAANEDFDDMDAFHEDIDDDDDDLNEDIQPMLRNTDYTINKRLKMITFPLPSYWGDDTLMIVAYLASALFIFSLIVVVPLINEIFNAINLALAILAVVCAAIGIFLDGKFYLMFNYQTKQIYVQQRMCIGQCICGNKGAQGKLLGDFSSFVSAEKIKLNDVIGENKWPRWQFALLFKDFENGEDLNVLFATTKEMLVDTLQENINEWWKEYEMQNDIHVEDNALDDYH